MPFEASKLPSITRFLTGLVTNRNPVDTPFSVIGLNTIMHHDVLNDGENTELSAYDTVQRRPGWQSFLTGTTVDVFQYKDLNGNIFILRDSGLELFNGENGLIVNSPGAGLWSMVGQGNFLYVTNGVNQNRIDDNGTTLSSIYGWGQSSPQTAPSLTFQSLGYFNAVSNFIPTADIIGGSIVVEDPSNDRILSITINNATIHFNVTYTGNQISTNQSYTTVTSQTQVTGPPQVTTDVVTVTSSYQDILTSAGTSNGVMNYYPNTGVSTLDFDVGFTAGTMTLSGLSTIINTQAAVNWPGKAIKVPPINAQLLSVFATSTTVAGLYHQPGVGPQPANTGIALNMQYSALFDFFTSSGQTVSFDSGLFDVTNPQLPLDLSIGSAPRAYQYVTPAVNVTDTFTGSITIELVNASTHTTTFSFVAQTLEQIALGLRNSNWNPIYVQTGSTCYMVLRNFQATTPSTSQDSVLCITANSLVDLADTNLNFQSWTFIETNDWAQLPLQGVDIVYAIRDVFSGGLSNVSPSVTVGIQIYPCRWNVSLSLPFAVYNPAAPAPENGNQNLEVYRTVDGGSSFLFEQLLNYQNLELYSTNFTITDDGLNDQLIGPIDEENDPPPVGLNNVVSHTGRLWGILGNRVYYSGGPDTTNGNGDEAWPPGNNFQFPGLITDIKSLDSGLIVALGDDLHVITGVDSSSYYAKPWLIGFGISNKNAWVQDSSGLYLYTSKQQLHMIAPGESKEIGFDIGDQLLANFPAATSSVTFHRGSSLDTALYISNGTDTIFRYNPARRAWSPKALPLVNAGRVKSLETSVGVNTLLNANAGGVWQRNLSVFSDNGAAYPAFFTIGVIQLAPQGQVATINNIATQSAALGTLHQTWLLLNEVNGSVTPFLRLQRPLNDPPDAFASQTLFAKRWYTEQTLSPFPSGTRLVNLLSIKIVFSSTDTVKNEVYGVFLRDKQ